MVERVQLSTWRSAYRDVREALDAPHEAKILLEEVAGSAFFELVLDFDRPIGDDAIARLDELVARRRTGIPLQHLIGHWPFCGVELIVDRRALIPRPETEEVVETALRELGVLRSLICETPADHPRQLNVVDLGTGSGAVSCALATGDAEIDIFAIDRSVEALSLARENVARLDLHVRERIRCIEADWLSPFIASTSNAIDLVIANPPYVSAAEWSALDPVVRDHDPVEALVAGETGLEDLQAIIEQTPHILSERGTLICEIGATQGEATRELARQSGASGVQILQDLSGRDRILVARYGHE